MRGEHCIKHRWITQQHDDYITTYVQKQKHL